MKRSSRKALSRQQSLIIAINFYMRLGLWPMLAAALASMVTTYNGVVIITDWLAGDSTNVALVALMVSFVAAGISFCSWLMTINLLQLYVTGRARLIGALVLIYLIVMTALGSTFTSAIGMTEQSARAMYLLQEARLYANFARIVGARAQEMRNAEAAIEPEARDACTKSDAEMQGGMISGSRGTGPVASLLQTLCVRKTALQEAISATLAEAQPLIDEISGISHEMDRLILDRSVSLADRETGFFEKARDLEARLQALLATDRIDAIRFNYEAIGKTVGALDDLKATVSQGQANALTGIIAGERASAETMQGMIARIEARPLPEAVRAEPMPVPLVTLQFAWAHVPQWALAASLDAFGPISALLFFAGSLRRIRNSTTQEGELR